MNKVILHGNLGADPELKEKKGELPVCKFRVATHEGSRTKEGEKKELTEWHSVVAFGKTAELCQKFLKKGDSALIEGKIRSSRYKNNAGEEKVSFEILAQNVKFLSKKANAFEDEE